MNIKAKQISDGGNGNMKIEEIRVIAKQMGVKMGKMKKGEIIRAIQEAEGNPICFDTAKADACGQARCLWRDDCK